MLVLEQPTGFIHYPLSPLEGEAGDITTDAWMFALTNLASIGYGLAADYFVTEKTGASEKVINGGTIAASALAATFSFKMAIDPDPTRNPIWRLLGGFFTYMNVVVALRSAIDLFRETHKLPGLHKLAREILAV